MPVFAINEARTSTLGPPTVLIVDDEPAIAETLSLILQRAGYRTIIAHSGEQAVEHAKTSPPDALVCDIVLPGIGGIEAARTIRARCPECRIILVTGDSLNAELPNITRSGEFELLTKPFHPVDLIEKLGKRTVAESRRKMAAA